MVVARKPVEEIETGLRVELHGMAGRHKRGKKFFQVWAVYAPAFGLLTTLIGQCVMLKNMGSDIGKIGEGMAVALLGTLYGSVLSNLFLLPFSDKLDARASEELLVKELYLQGILAMAEESPAMVLKQRLLLFLDDKSAQRAATSI